MTLGRFVAAAAVAIGLAPMGAVAASSHEAPPFYVWATNDYGMYQNLFFGTPDSDNWAVNARCEVGADRVHMIVAGFVEGRRNGEEAVVTMRLRRADAVVEERRYRGVVFGVGLDIGAPGAEIALSPSDPLFAALGGGESLSVAIEDGPAIRMSLQGAAAPAKRFAWACAG